MSPRVREGDDPRPVVGKNPAPDVYVAPVLVCDDCLRLLTPPPDELERGLPWSPLVLCAGCGEQVKTQRASWVPGPEGAAIRDVHLAEARARASGE